jgi:hypothetical protein
MHRRFCPPYPMRLKVETIMHSAPNTHPGNILFDNRQIFRVRVYEGASQCVEHGLLSFAEVVLHADEG